MLDSSGVSSSQLIDWSRSCCLQFILLTTFEAAWYIISIVSVCQAITFESLDVYDVHICTCGISPRNTGHVRIWRSSGQGQGHRSKKVENPYSRNVKLRSAISPVLQNIESRDIKFACNTGYSDMADRMVWPPSLSCDRKWPWVTKCTYSRVVDLWLEGTVILLSRIWQQTKSFLPFYGRLQNGQRIGYPNSSVSQAATYHQLNNIVVPFSLSKSTENRYVKFHLWGRGDVSEAPYWGKTIATPLTDIAPSLLWKRKPSFAPVCPLRSRLLWINPQPL